MRVLRILMAASIAFVVLAAIATADRFASEDSPPAKAAADTTTQPLADTETPSDPPEPEHTTSPAGDDDEGKIRAVMEVDGEWKIDDYGTHADLAAPGSDESIEPECVPAPC